MLPIPEYTIRESSRAKHVRLKVSMRDGIVVVVPKGFDKRAIPAIVRKKQDWLTRVQSRMQIRHESVPQEVTSLRPSTIHLNGIGATWAVVYKTIPSDRVSLKEQADNVLTVSGDVSCDEACGEVLKLWLKHKAREMLIPRLHAIASEHGVEIQTVRIKNQRTRWGSCSSKRAINLNMKLLFLSPVLVKYVMIHELCHMRHLDHSPRFWNLVERFDPEYRLHDQELRNVWLLIPQWAF